MLKRYTLFILTIALVIAAALTLFLVERDHSGTMVCAVVTDLGKRRRG